MFLVLFIKKLWRPHVVLSLTIFIFSFLAILGWVFQIPSLIRINTNYVPIVFNTALLLLVLSAGILLFEAGFEKTSRLMAVVVAAFSTCVFLQYLANRDWGLDTFFVQPFLPTHYDKPGRMAGSVCVAMILSSVALFFNTSSWLCRYLRSISATLVFGFSVIFLSSYIFDFNAEYGWGVFSRMSIQTSICFILLALAFLFQLAHRVHKQAPSTMYVSAFSMLVSGVLISLIFWQLLVFKDFEKNRRMTEVRAESLKSALDNSFYPLETSLQNMAQRFAHNKYKTYEMWSLDSESYIDDFDSIKRITWADKNFVTRWVYPKANDGYKLINFDLSKDRELSLALGRVWAEKTPTLSKMIQLKTGGQGFALLIPIYKQTEFLGVLTAAIVAKPFFEHVARVPGYDLTILEENRELISAGRRDDAFTRDWSYRTSYLGLGVQWTIILIPTLETIKENISLLPFFVLLFGITVSVLLSLAIGFYQKATLAERQVRENLEWQNASRDSISLLVVTTDADVLIRDANVAARSTLGYSMEELKGRCPFDFYDQEEVEKNRQNVERSIGRSLKTTREHVEAIFELGLNRGLERVLISKSGRRIVTEAIVSQVRSENGRVSGYMVIYEDVTQKKEREQLLAEQQKMIQTSSRLASLGEMAAGIAHEINNPLAIISGYVSILRKVLHQKGYKDAEVDSRIDMIDSTVHRMAKIIRGLRIYSRESHDGDHEVASLASILDDTLIFCQEKFRNHAVTLKTEVDPNLQVRCRPYQISQVILNLLNNACDAVADIEVREVEVKACSVDGGIEIAVTDSGPGVPKASRSKIMQPFFTTKEVGNGVGLGLSISQGIMQGHEGRLYLDESSEKTRFVIWLPT